MACDPIIFYNVTPARWEEIKFKARGYGIGLRTDQGEAEKDGVRVAWLLDITTNTLTVQCTKKPFYYPASKVNAELRKALEG